MGIPIKSFVETLAVNIDNKELSDEAFRQFCRNTVPSIEGIDYESLIKNEKEKGQ
ncbi:unnamed protein product [marine sediment metagenome]|uniref:Uncharacterized protein n=1 Tax=marine sediment metagenome TaxID=412755 RepID=X0XFD8_9ZZZZ